ncbi:MAG TPA: hypothetical protein VMU48_01845, partial [Terracidiphilus sp.]|nr:hypothetical protein [Terracidiphilus sp.]
SGSSFESEVHWASLLPLKLFCETWPRPRMLRAPFSRIQESFILHVCGDSKGCEGINQPRKAVMQRLSFLWLFPLARLAELDEYMTNSHAFNRPHLMQTVL